MDGPFALPDWNVTWQEDNMAPRPPPEQTFQEYEEDFM